MFGAHVVTAWHDNTGALAAKPTCITVRNCMLALSGAIRSLGGVQNEWAGAVGMPAAKLDRCTRTTMYDIRRPADLEPAVFVMARRRISSML
ncbi:MAG: hypothetical protein JWO42_3382 [Chloroflexi bacterium]|jgi:hypothetical protein|nr:hypothetical protein [Chloroflexota bacterium]